MQKLLSGVFVLSLCIAPVADLVLVQPSRAQVPTPEQQAQQLLQQSFQQAQQGQSQQAIETLQKVLSIARQLKNKQIEAAALEGLGATYSNANQPQQALSFYNQALTVFKEVGDRQGEGSILINAGAIYKAIGQPRRALSYFNKALPIFKEVGDRQGETTILTNIGESHQILGQPREALSYYNQALSIRQAIGNRRGEATTLNNISTVYLEFGQPQQALLYLNKALSIVKELNNRQGEATTLTNIAGVFYAMGQPQQALSYLNQALPIFKEVGNHQREAATLNNISTLYLGFGQARQALPYLEQALSITKEVEDRRGEATTLINIGRVYGSLGQLQQALSQFNQALPIFREVGARQEEATTRANIGGVYLELGRLKQALFYLNQALIVFKEAGNRWEAASTLSSISGAYETLKQPKQALSYLNQALLIFKEIGNRQGEASTLESIGGVYWRFNQPKRALSYFNQALPIFKEVGARRSEATTLASIGTIYLELNQPQRALSQFNQALPILEKVGARSGEAVVLSNIAGVYRETEQPLKAIAQLKRSVEITLAMRQALQKENRQSFLEVNDGPVAALVVLLLQQKQVDQAFGWVNRFTTFELADYTRLVGQPFTNPEVQQAVDQWNQKQQQLEGLRKQVQNPKTFSEAKSRQMRALEQEVNYDAENIANKYPEAAELFESNPEEIAQLQTKIPQGTLVIQPVLLPNVRNVPNTLAFFLLSKNSSVTVKQIPINPQAFNALIDQYRKQLKDPTDSGLNTSQKKLYDQLIRPIEADIDAIAPKQVSFILTGKLRYISFETFYDSHKKQYLIEKYPISYLTRLSTRSLSLTDKRQANPKSLRVLAVSNPVPRDPYDLKGAAEEANLIAQEFPGSEVLSGNQATLDAFKVQAPRFSYLHLATHGCFDSKGCCLGKQCLQSFQANLEPNTLLFADKQYNISEATLLGLNNVELIVLSACQTAQEANVNDQSVAGLAYLFERAGARSVIGSLWNAPDATTSGIMVQFYRNLKTMPKAEALQKAKLQHIGRHPFWWASMVLIGDPR